MDNQQKLPKRPNINWKRVAIISLIVGILLGGVALLFLQKDTTKRVVDYQKTEWITYADTKYNFEIKYPETWTMDPNSNHYGKASKIFCPPEFTEIRDSQKHCKLIGDDPYKFVAIRFDQNDIDSLPIYPSPEHGATGWIDSSKKYYYEFNTTKYKEYGDILEQMRAGFRFTK